MDRVQEHRTFFARMITANAGIPPGSELEAAFASTPRERFVPPGPWKVYAPQAGYIETPSDDPAFLYQDVVVSLGTDGPLNNGQPTLHAVCIAALAIKQGDRIVHIGSGTGYYTALLAELTGKDGFVDAYEVEPSLAQQASRNLAEYPQVAVHHRSGSEAPIPECDVIYVSAGATEPLSVWLDALRPKGRLLFPLTPAEGVGAMLLVTQRLDGRYDARFVVQAMFVPCAGARDLTTILGSRPRGGRFRCRPTINGRYTTTDAPHQQHCVCSPNRHAHSCGDARPGSIGRVSSYRGRWRIRAGLDREDRRQ